MVDVIHSNVTHKKFHIVSYCYGLEKLLLIVWISTIRIEANDFNNSFNSLTFSL